jgi:hypothetical protein
MTNVVLAYQLLLTPSTYFSIFRSKSPILASERKLFESQVFLFSDMLLITFEKDGKYIVKDFKEHNPAILLHTITQIHAEITCALFLLRTLLGSCV